QQEQNSCGKEQKSCHLVKASGLTGGKEPHPTGGRKKPEQYSVSQIGKARHWSLKIHFNRGQDVDRFAIFHARLESPLLKGTDRLVLEAHPPRQVFRRPRSATRLAQMPVDTGTPPGRDG